MILISEPVENRAIVTYGNESVASLPEVSDESAEEALVVDEKRPVAGAMRTCVVTRKVLPREQLLRFVVDPAGRLMEDLGGRLPGRAAYVTPAWPHVAALLRRPGILRRLGGDGHLTLPDAPLLQERLASGLNRRWREGIGLARRAGGLRKGLGELEEVLGRGSRPLVLLASDTAVNTRQKLAGMLHRHGQHGVVIPMELLDRDRFGDVCGMGPVAVLTITSEGIAKRVKNDSERWKAYFNSIH